MKKILISLGALTTVTGTVVGVTSCGVEKRIETLPVKTGVAFSINGVDTSMDTIFREWAITNPGKQMITEQMLDDLTFEVFKNGTLKNPDGSEWKNNDKTPREIFEEIEKEVDAKIEEEINIRKKAYRWDWEGKMQMDLYDKHGGSKETYKKWLMVHWSENGGAYNLKQLLLDSLWATVAKSEEEIKDTTNPVVATKDELLSPFQQYIADNFESIYGTDNIRRVSALLIKYAKDEFSTLKSTNIYWKQGNSKTNIIVSGDGQYILPNGQVVDEAYLQSNPSGSVERNYEVEPFNATTSDYSKSSFEKLEDLISGLPKITSEFTDFEETNLRNLTEDNGVFNNIVYPDAHWGTRFKEAVLASDGALNTSTPQSCLISGDVNKNAQNYIKLLEGQDDVAGAPAGTIPFNGNYCVSSMTKIVGAPAGGDYILFSRNSFGYHFMKVKEYNIDNLLSEYVAGVQSDTGFGTKINILNELKSWANNKYLPSWSANYWLASYLWNSTNILNKTKELFGINYNPWFNQLTGSNASIKDEFSKLYTLGNTGTNITTFASIRSEINKITEKEIWTLNKTQADKLESFTKEQEDARKNAEWEKLANIVVKTIDITKPLPLQI